MMSTPQHRQRDMNAYFREHPQVSDGAEPRERRDAGESPDAERGTEPRMREVGELDERPE